jgi:hypothetical protein
MRVQFRENEVSNHFKYPFLLKNQKTSNRFWLHQAYKLIYHKQAGLAKKNFKLILKVLASNEFDVNTWLSTKTSRIQTSQSIGTNENLI